jgi:metal-responsive CopG/Arc/MetJ family transcriptional regulator
MTKRAHPPVDEKAKRLSITLTPDRLAKLDALCLREGRTRSNLIARLLDRVPS